MLLYSFFSCSMFFRLTLIFLNLKLMSSFIFSLLFLYIIGYEFSSKYKFRGIPSATKTWSFGMVFFLLLSSTNYFYFSCDFSLSCCLVDLWLLISRHMRIFRFSQSYVHLACSGLNFYSHLTLKTFKNIVQLLSLLSS